MHEFDALLIELQGMQARVKLGGNHRYSADGKFRPGVTTVIKTLDAPSLDEWKVRVQVEGTARAAYSNPPMENEPLDGYVARLKKLGAEEYEHQRLADEAAKVGVDGHALIEHAVKEMLGQKPEAPKVCEEAVFRFSGWRQWAKDVGLKPLASESRLFNEAHDYCGTLDCLALAEGRPTLLDWKPTAVLYPERRLQSAAYRKALASMGWPEMDGAIVCIPREGGDIQMLYAEPPGPALDATFDVFLSLLQVYRWQRETAKQDRQAERLAPAV